MSAFILFLLGYLVFLVSIFNPIVLSRSVNSTYKGLIEKVSPKVSSITKILKEKNKYLKNFMSIVENLFRWPQIINSICEKRNRNVDNNFVRLYICLIGVGINTGIYMLIGCLLMPTIALEFIQFFLKIIQGESFRLGQLILKILDIFTATEINLTALIVTGVLYIILNFYYLLSTYDSLKKLNQIRSQHGDKNITIQENHINIGEVKLKNVKLEVLNIKNAVVVLRCINIKTLSVLFLVYLFLKITNMALIDNALSVFGFISISVGAVSYATSVAPVHTKRIVVHILQFVNEVIKERESKPKGKRDEGSKLKEINVFGSMNKKND